MRRDLEEEVSDAFLGMLTAPYFARCSCTHCESLSIPLYGNNPGLPVPWDCLALACTRPLISGAANIDVWGRQGWGNSGGYYFAPHRWRQGLWRSAEEHRPAEYALIYAEKFLHRAHGQTPPCVCVFVAFLEARGRSWNLNNLSVQSLDIKAQEGVVIFRNSCLLLQLARALWLSFFPNAAFSAHSPSALVAGSSYLFGSLSLRMRVNVRMSERESTRTSEQTLCVCCKVAGQRGEKFNASNF